MSRKNYDPESAKQHTKEAQERLQAAVETLMTSEGWTQYLKNQSKFHSYSWGNTLLIWAQKPEASHLKGFKGWLDLGRQVRKGERGIRILAPRPWQKSVEGEDGEQKVVGGVSFTTVSVFDVSQTDPVPGHPNPFDPSQSPFTNPEERGDPVVCGQIVDALVSYNTGEGRKVKLGGDLHPRAAGFFRPGDDLIWIKEGDVVKMATTFIHETAHALTHKTINAQEGYAAGEVVAESVAYIVADYFGLDSELSSTEYVAGWLSKDPGGFKKGMALIQKTAHDLIETLSGSLSGEPAAA
jgi:antirestriction protein ArdC